MASTAMRTASSETVRTVLKSTGSGRLLRLVLLDLDRGAPVVLTAVGAGVMNLLGLVALRARLQVRDADRQMGAAVALSRVRNSPLGDSHWFDYSFSLRRR